MNCVVWVDGGGDEEGWAGEGDGGGFDGAAGDNGQAGDVGTAGAVDDVFCLSLHGPSQSSSLDEIVLRLARDVRHALDVLAAMDGAGGSDGGGRGEGEGGVDVGELDALLPAGDFGSRRVVGGEGGFAEQGRAGEKGGAGRASLRGRRGVAHGERRVEGGRR